MADARWLDCPVVIPYMGGKFELSRTLVPMLAPHVRYIEVFAGGLSMFFRKKKADWNVVNDVDRDIINLYESIRTDYDSFKEQAYWMVKSRELFNKWKKEVNNKEDINIPDPERAAKYYYVIRCAFNRSAVGTLSKDSDWHTRLLNDIKYSRLKFDDTIMEHMDFRDLVKKYPPRKGDMWYLDPPYVIAGERGDYYHYSFSKKDHEDMAEICKEIDNENGKFMVSYDDRYEVKSLFHGYNIIPLKVLYSGMQHNKKEKTELAICNYQPSGQSSLF
jgi:DNA adenine methylase|tara:strand:- start:1210 stop:2034 length:825 start_codon:yes stop_codon:yes gene_type:complete